MENCRENKNKTPQKKKEILVVNVTFLHIMVAWHFRFDLKVVGNRSNRYVVKHMLFGILTWRIIYGDLKVIFFAILHWRPTFDEKVVESDSNKSHTNEERYVHGRYNLIRTDLPLNWTDLFLYVCMWPLLSNIIVIKCMLQEKAEKIGWNTQYLQLILLGPN